MTIRNHFLNSRMNFECIFHPKYSLVTNSSFKSWYNFENKPFHRKQSHNFFNGLCTPFESINEWSTTEKNINFTPLQFSRDISWRTSCNLNMTICLSGDMAIQRFIAHKKKLSHFVKSYFNSEFRQCPCFPQTARRKPDHQAFSKCFMHENFACPVLQKQAAFSR